MLKEGLKQSCVRVDQSLQLKYAKQGTTALIGLIVDKNVYLAWVGDSRGLIFSHPSPKEEPTLKMATVDHKPDSPQELARIGVENVTRTQIIKNSDGHKAIVYRPLHNSLPLEPGQKLLKEGPAPHRIIKRFRGP